MKHISFCSCGSAMSHYEVEQFGQCTACEVEKKKQQIERQKKEEQEQLQRKKEEQVRRKQEYRQKIQTVLQKIEGKTIASAHVIWWKEIGGCEEPERVRLTFTDDSIIEMEAEYDEDDCTAYLSFE